MTTSQKKRALLEAENDTKKVKTEIMSTLQEIKSFCKDRQERSSTALQVPTPPSRIPTSSLDLTDRNVVFEEIVRCNNLLNDKANLDTLSPRTREKYVVSMQGRRKRFIDVLADLEQMWNRTSKCYIR